MGLVYVTVSPASRRQTTPGISNGRDWIQGVSYACDRIAERPNWGLWGSSESSENKKEAAPILRLKRQQEEIVFPVSKSWDQLLGMRNIMRTAYRSWDRWGRSCLVGPGTTKETQVPTTSTSQETERERESFPCHGAGSCAVRWGEDFKCCPGCKPKALQPLSATRSC